MGQKWFHLVIRYRGNIKKVDDYSQKLVNDFKLIFLNPSPKLTDQEKGSIATSFGCFYHDQCIETNTKRVLTHVLKTWNENKSISHTITCALTPAETVALKMYSIELKYCSWSLVIYSQSEAHYDSNQMHFIYVGISQ